MPKCRRPPIHQDANVLTAIVEYRRAGLDAEAIMGRLRVSRRTYYRCLAAIRQARRDAAREHDD